MKLGIMSDLHLEFERGGHATSPVIDYPEGHPKIGPLLTSLKGVDAVLLAGDIDLGFHGLSYAEAVWRYLEKPVAYIAGNHELYGQDTSLYQRLADAPVEGLVCFMENHSLTDSGLPGTIILGCTLWTDYDLYGNAPMAMWDAQRGLNDHRRISHDNHIFLPSDALAMHQTSRDWLDQEATKARANYDKVVIMTHHVPVPEGIGRGHGKGDLTAAYASDMRAEVDRWQPDLWVSGHTHSPHDFMLGKTRFVSAPRGYIGYEKIADGYEPMVVEL